MYILKQLLPFILLKNKAFANLKLNSCLFEYQNIKYRLINVSFSEGNQKSYLSEAHFLTYTVKSTVLINRTFNDLNKTNNNFALSKRTKFNVN